MSMPTGPIRSSPEQPPFQTEQMSAMDQDTDFDEGYNQQILGRPLGFIPLYMLPSSSLRQKMRQQQLQQGGLERNTQMWNEKAFPERQESPNLNQENLNFDPEQQRSGKTLMDPTSIQLPEGHQPVTVDQLLTGSSEPKQSDDSPVINPPNLNRENLDTIDSQKQSTLIDPSSIHLPAGHPPVPLDEMVPSESLQNDQSNLEGNPSHIKLEPFELPPERQSEMINPQERERSLNPLEQTNHREQHLSPLDEPRAMPRQKRQCGHHHDSPHRSYDHVYDRETGVYPEDFILQSPREDWDDVYESSDVVDVFHHVV